MANTFNDIKHIQFNSSVGNTIKLVNKISGTFEYLVLVIYTAGRVQKNVYEIAITMDYS